MFERLQKLMDKRGISLFYLSRQTGVPYSCLTNWKRGRSKPKVDKLIKIADYFGIALDYFY